jgi:hypothetical protein
MSEGYVLTEVMTKLHDLLEPLDASERTKVVKAALTLLGDPSNIAPDKPEVPPDGDDADGGDVSFPPKVRGWMKSNDITAEQVSHVFHSDGGEFEIIAGDAPGTNNKEKTINAYILTGLSRYLKTGDAKFDDKDAREVCRKFGCLNEGNHASYMKNTGNVLSGSKGSGWTVTGPGLKAAAVLVKGLAGA